jgi:hypothetical protein
MHTYCPYRVAASRKIEHLSRIYRNTTDPRIRALCSKARNAYAFRHWVDSMTIAHVVIAHADTAARHSYDKAAWEAANDFDRCCARHDVTPSTVIADVTDIETADRRDRR